MTEEPLQPQSLGDRTPDQNKGKSSSTRKTWMWAVCGLLIGLGIVGWLSSSREPPPPEIRSTPTPTPLPQPTEDPARRAAADDALEKLLTVLGPLKTTDPELWGGETWQSLMHENSRGDQALADQQWSEAEMAYTSAFRRAQELESRKKQVPDRIFPEAYEAYGKGNREVAVRILEAILQIDPDHKEAKALTPRAEVADQTFERYQRALTQVDQGNIDLAFVEINRARSLDNEFPGVQVLAEKIEGQLVETELKNILGRAYAALDANDLTTAQAAIDEALALAPDHSGVKDAQAQVTARVTEQRVLTLKKKAEDLRSQEKWKESHKVWLEMEALDPDAPWIRQGLTESLRWAVIHEKILRGLQFPTRKQTGEWVQEFKDREGWPEGLAAKAQELEDLRNAWTTPVPVKILSDGETEVTIPRKGRWKNLIEKEISLLPGTYVAKGGRLGYRDVRVEFTVPPGGEPVTVTVICVEGI